MQELGHEWLALQGQFERYEGHALLIKLFAAGLCGVSIWTIQNTPMLLTLLLVLWLQEGILRTVQNRLGERIVRLEQACTPSGNNAVTPFQLHSDWQKARPGAMGLVREYARNALRPTVAFPYVILAPAVFLL